MPKWRQLSRSTAASAGSSSSERQRRPCGRPASACRTQGNCSWRHRPDGDRAVLPRAVDVGGRDDAGACGRPLPEHREIEAEQLADPAQRVLDLAVHLAGRQVDEPRGEVGDQRLELETAPEVLGGGLRLIDRGHSGGVYPLGRVYGARRTKYRPADVISSFQSRLRAPRIGASRAPAHRPKSNLLWLIRRGQRRAAPVAAPILHNPTGRQQAVEIRVVARRRCTDSASGPGARSQEVDSRHEEDPRRTRRARRPAARRTGPEARHPDGRDRADDEDRSDRQDRPPRHPQGQGRRDGDDQLRARGEAVRRAEGRRHRHLPLLRVDRLRDPQAGPAERAAGADRPHGHPRHRARSPAGRSRSRRPPRSRSRPSTRRCRR